MKQLRINLNVKNSAQQQKLDSYVGMRLDKVRMMKKSLSIAFGLATRSSYARLNRVSGFTLIELMVVVVVVAIIAAIAMPNYMQYMERRDLAIARQEALKIAAELERFKAKTLVIKVLMPAISMLMTE